MAVNQLKLKEFDINARFAQTLITAQLVRSILNMHILLLKLGIKRRVKLLLRSQLLTKCRTKSKSQNLSAV